MKKNRNIFIVALVLALLAAFLVFRNKTGTIKSELQDFAVPDTGSITKIFLADRNNHSVLLERKDHYWTVNGKHKAAPDGIRILLETIKKVSVKNRVAKSGFKGIVADLGANGVKCEIYQRNESIPMKVYYVGGSTADVKGTFMMLEHSSLPFITEIRGFEGYLTPRYSPFEQSWRDRTLFSYPADSIGSITLLYSHEPEKSFSIERSGNHFRVFSPVTGKPAGQVDTIALDNYLSFFNALSFEDWDSELSDQQRDSLKRIDPVTTVIVHGLNGSADSMITYPKPVNSRSLAQTDPNGNPLKYDLDRMYAFINSGKELVTIQYFVFGKIFRELNDFDSDKTRKQKK